HENFRAGLQPANEPITLLTEFLQSQLYLIELTIRQFPCLHPNRAERAKLVLQLPSLKRITKPPKRRASAAHHLSFSWLLRPTRRERRSNRAGVIQQGHHSSPATRHTNESATSLVFRHRGISQQH